jgi:hypothetical protein
MWYYWMDSLFEDGSTIAVLHKEEAVMWYKIWRYLSAATADSAGKWEDSRDILNASGFQLPGRDDCAVMQLISFTFVTRHVREYDQDFECNNLSSSLCLHYKQGFHIAWHLPVNSNVEAVKGCFICLIGMVCTREENDF